MTVRDIEHVCTNLINIDLFVQFLQKYENVHGRFYSDLPKDHEVPEHFLGLVIADTVYVFKHSSGNKKGLTTDVITCRRKCPNRQYIWWCVWNPYPKTNWFHQQHLTAIIQINISSHTIVIIRNVLKRWCFSGYKPTSTFFLQLLNLAHLLKKSAGMLFISLHRGQIWVPSENMCTVCHKRWWRNLQLTLHGCAPDNTPDSNFKSSFDDLDLPKMRRSTQIWVMHGS